MSDLMIQAISELQELSEAEQDRLAEWILAELESERRWANLLADSPGVLAHLADEARTELE